MSSTGKGAVGFTRIKRGHCRGENRQGNQSSAQNGSVGSLGFGEQEANIEKIIRMMKVVLLKRAENLRAFFIIESPFHSSTTN